jgi:Variant SH3 domain
MKVDYAFDAEGDGEMSISIGDLITVLEEVDPGWFIGEILGEEGRNGMFPATYCSIVEQPRRMLKPPSSPGKDGKGEKGDVFSEMEEQVSSLSLRRPVTIGVRPVAGRTVSSTSITPVGATKKKPPPPPVSRGSKPLSTTGSATITSSTTTTGSDLKCRECGCDEFRANVFKKGSCNNCFHVHIG